MGTRTRRPTPWQADREALNRMTKPRVRKTKIDDETHKFSHSWKRRLWAIAQEQGMNIPDVAAACGVPRHSLWKILVEPRDVTTDTLADICRGMNLSATWLLFGVGRRECIAK